MFIKPKHFPARLSNRITIYNRSSEAIYTVLLRSKIPQNISAFFDSLARKLYYTRRALVHRADFELVNIYSPYTNYSFGTHPRPPDNVIYPYTKLVLTFSITPNSFYRYPLFVNDRLFWQRLTERFYFWRLNRDGRSFRFISVSYSPSDLAKWNVDSVLLQNLQYLYYIFAILTKNFVMKCRFYSTEHNYEIQAINKVTLALARNSYSRMPLQTMIRDLPYYLWVYNRLVWKLAPNLIAEWQVTPHVVLFWVTTINDSAFIVPDSPIVKHLMTAVLSFHQRISDTSDTNYQLTDSDLALSFLLAKVTWRRVSLHLTEEELALRYYRLLSYYQQEYQDNKDEYTLRFTYPSMIALDLLQGRKLFEKDKLL